MSTHNKRQSVFELTKNCNEIFRVPAKLPPMTAPDMADTLSKMPEFNVSRVPYIICMWKVLLCRVLINDQRYKDTLN